jgi:Oxysterol-binding protein
MNYFRRKSSAPAGKAEAEDPAFDDDMAKLAVSGSHGDDGDDAGAQASDSDRQSVWGLLKGKLGGEVSMGISLPVSFFEPTSTLQRMAEMLHFSDLLDQAAEQRSSLDKLVYVAIFACTNYNSTQRFCKPFNPVLGETFEFVDEELGVHLVSEQVSHHPPMSAVHCEGRRWVFWQDGRPTTRFNGNSLDVFPNSKTHVYIPRSRDHFVFEETPSSRINNLIIGRSWMEHTGEFVIRNLKTGDVATLTFDKSSWAPWRSTKHVVRGEVNDSDGTTFAKLSGRWSESISCEWVKKFPKMSESTGTSKEVWRVPENNKVGKYDFTEFTHRLNEMQTDEEDAQGVSYEELLPRTDSRLRPDRVALEKYGAGGASRLKTLVEERQRTDRKARASAGDHWRPQWFRCIRDDAGTGGRRKKGDTSEPELFNPHDEDAEPAENIWVYHGDYWEQRAQRVQWLADKDTSEAGAQPDDSGAESDSDGVERDEDRAGKEPLEVTEFTGLACDFRSYEKEEDEE